MRFAGNRPVPPLAGDPLLRPSSPEDRYGGFSGYVDSLSETEVNLLAVAMAIAKENPRTVRSAESMIIGSVGGMTEVLLKHDMVNAGKWHWMLKGMVLMLTDDENAKFKKKYPAVMRAIDASEVEYIIPEYAHAAEEEAKKGYAKLQARENPLDPEEFTDNPTPAGFEPTVQWTGHDFEAVVWGPGHRIVADDDPTIGFGPAHATRADAEFFLNTVAAKDPQYGWWIEHYPQTVLFRVRAPTKAGAVRKANFRAREWQIQRQAAGEQT